MAWNPEPEVAVARDYGKRFGFDMVLIIGISNGKLGCATFGKTKVECRAASLLGKEAMEAVEKRLAVTAAMLDKELLT